MKSDMFKQLSSETDWQHVGRRRQQIAKSTYRRGSRRDRARRNQRNYILLSIAGVLLGAAAAYVIHFTIVKVMIGATAGLVAGLTLGLLVES